MTTAVYKYQLKAQDVQLVALPLGARVLSVHVQREQICVWAQVPIDEPTQRTEIHTFRIFGTGHPMHGKLGDFIGTILMAQDSLVFHVYHIKPE